MKKCVRIRAISTILAVILCLNGEHKITDAATITAYDDYKEILSYTDDVIDYKTYLESFGETIRPDSVIEIEADSYSSVQEMNVEEYENYNGYDGTAIYTEESGLIEYEFTVEETGLYEISIDYYPVEGKNASIQRSFFLDGELPYKEMSLVEFSRVWVNKTNTWTVDNQGNDLKPTQVEAPEWLNAKCYDCEGYINKPLSVFLTEGTHTLTVISRREPMVLGKIILSNSKELKSYAELMAQNEEKGYVDAHADTIELQAEYAHKKSSQMLYPTQDQSSPAIYPYSAKELKNNTIGGYNWRLIGQWLEWEFTVPEDGYYNITLHEKQNFVKGTFVSRKIYIDGAVPFDELNSYRFNYDTTWKMNTLSSTEGESFKFYLSKGTHTIRMEVVLGDFAEIVGNVQKILREINDQYREIVQITGVSPDEFRDYEIEASLPNLKGNLEGIRDELDTIIQQLRMTTGGGSDKETILITMRDQLTTITKDVEVITKLLPDFKTNMSALGTWIQQVIEQPLQLDAIYISSPGTKVEDIHNSFWDKISHEIKRLYWSFLIDYNSIGNVAEEGSDSRTITVWVGSGRDQANVIKSLIDERFTVNSNINVNVMLVDMNTLLQATLSGEGPDVALQVGNGGTAAAAFGTNYGSNDIPVNYGIRSAVVDLTSIVSEEEMLEVTERFRDSALEPFMFEGAIYALPETQVFPMMFYRKDIFKELGIEVPQTWEDIKVVLSVLNENQMEVGMHPTESLWLSILYQNGGTLYTPDNKSSALDSVEAINAFVEYCEFYTDYKLDRETSVEQRFRTGEAPIIISDYTTYNNFQVSAPDIKGLWGFAPIPGVLNEDGTVNHASASTGLACMMMEDCEDKEAAWEFMKWWTSAEIQTVYGQELEGLMGAAARYPTANVEAFNSLPWPTEDYEALLEQFDQIHGIKQVPGGYYSWRNVNNAFYRVVTSAGAEKLQPREALTEYIRYINKEISYKREEFGMAID